MRSVLSLLVCCAIAASTTIASASNLEMDPTFGEAGVILFGDLDPGSRIAFTVDPSGRIVLAGSVDDQAVVRRYLADGTLDAGFGSSGETSIAFGLGTEINDVTIDGIGRIVVAGSALPPAAFDNTDYLVARLTAEGTLDGSFGASGIATYPIASDYGESATDVTVVAGKILVVGVVGNQFETGYNAVLRLNGDGSLDTGYGGGDGIATAGGSQARTFIGAAGTVIVSTYSDLTRVEADGSTTPLADLPVSSPAACIYVEADGDLLVVSEQGELFDLDATGALMSMQGSGNWPYGACDIAVDSDGHTLVTTRRHWSDGPSTPVVHRYAPDGRWDLYFADQGVADLPVGDWFTGAQLYGAHLYAAGYTRGTAPALGRFAFDNSRFDQFIDDNDSVFENDINALAIMDITRGCNPPANDNYCPNATLTRGQAAALLRRALDLATKDLPDAFIDDNGSVFENDINALAEAGVTLGCNPPENDFFCPSETLTRGQAAAFIRRGLELPRSLSDAFTDDDGTTFELDINGLAEVGITRGCNPPVNTLFCPNDDLTRGQVAALVRRAFDIPIQD